MQNTKFKCKLQNKIKPRFFFANARRAAMTRGEDALTTFSLFSFAFFLLSIKSPASGSSEPLPSVATRVTLELVAVRAALVFER